MELSSTLSRREFVETLLGSVFASACSERDLRPSPHVAGELMGASAARGHLLRDDLRSRIAHVAALPATRTGVLIVGGGAAGLSAGHALARAGERDLLLLELEAAPGGTAIGGSSSVTAFPWGAHYLPVPSPDNAPLVALLEEMGVARGVDAHGELAIVEPHLVRAPEERLFYKGYWYPGLYLEAGASAADHRERARFEQLVARWVAFRDGAGRRAFVLPRSRASDAPEVRALDRLSASALLAQHGFRSSRLLWLLDYACRDDYGLGLAHTSAWALLFYFAARSERAARGSSEFITWPEGNQALVGHLAHALQGRIRADRLVLDVVQREQEVEVLAWDCAHDRGERYSCERAIVATPQFVTARIVRALREAGPTRSSFRYAPWLVANIHLAARPRAHGAPLAWDNVLYDSPSLGYVCATHQRGSDYGPTVWTYYLPLVDEEPRRARERLFAGRYEQYRDAVLSDLARAHPDLREHVTRLDVYRWGHAMVRPEVDCAFAPERARAREPLGRIHFAHSDLSALALFEEAFDHGQRAAREVLAARRSGG